MRRPCTGTPAAPAQEEEDHPLRKDLSLVNDGISQCEKSLNENKSKFELANSNYQLRMIEKDKIIEELGAINNLKQSEIQKLDELVKNFEELFGHYQEEVRDLWLNLFAGK